METCVANPTRADLSSAAKTTGIDIEDGMSRDEGIVRQCVLTEDAEGPVK